VNVSHLSVASGASFELGGSVLALQDASADSMRAMIAAGQITSEDVADSHDAATMLVFNADSLATIDHTSIDPRFFSFTAGSVAIPAYLGDVDLDGTVTHRDLQIIFNHLGDSASSDVGWFMGDVNQDGIVNATDEQLATANLRMTVVPEPTLALALTLFAACPLRTRQRVAKRRSIVVLKHMTPIDAR
jgi:hypothetical protein